MYVCLHAYIHKLCIVRYTCLLHVYIFSPSYFFQVPFTILLHFPLSVSRPVVVRQASRSRYPVMGIIGHHIQGPVPPGTLPWGWHSSYTTASSCFFLVCIIIFTFFLWFCFHHFFLWLFIFILHQFWFFRVSHFLSYFYVFLFLFILFLCSDAGRNVDKREDGWPGSHQVMSLIYLLTINGVLLFINHEAQLIDNLVYLKEPSPF